jgi:hypothetical protein
VVSKAGWRSREIHTVGGQNSLVTRSRAMVASSTAGSGPGRMTLVAPRYTSTLRKQSNCAQWYRGRECSSTSSALIPPSTAQLTYWLISERLDSITPFGRDSVPEVYISRSGSSSPTGTSGAVSGPVRHQSSTSSQPAAGAAPESPIHPRTPPSTPAAASASAAVDARASSVTIPVAPECRRT